VGRFLHRVFGDDWGIRSIDGYARPSSRQNRDALARFAMAMTGGYLALGFVLLLTIWVTDTEVPGLHLGPALLATLAGLACIGPMWMAFHRVHIAMFHLMPPIASLVVLAVGLTVGPEYEGAVVLSIVIITIILSVAIDLRIARYHLIALGVVYGILIADFDAPSPITSWAGTMGGAVIVAMVVDWLVRKNRGLAMAEHEASREAEHARAELAELAHTLEGRVAQQVADLDRLSELQRFLPATLVDAVLTGDDRLLAPHRAEIAVLFCDLRGFTAFTTASQPEDVHELLDSYFEVLGEHASEHGATVGAFTGDGLMAFFNDPIPVDDPARKALDLALDLHAAVDRLLGRWRRVGHEIGFGVGIALGYANIGMIGFEGRRDYTALGPVVNLSARLCAEAPSGGILLDPRAGVALEGAVDLGEPVLVHLKGFERTIEAVPVLSGFGA
jgi:class 3 adenylate cyclase